VTRAERPAPSADVTGCSCTQGSGSPPAEELVPYLAGLGVLTPVPLPRACRAAPGSMHGYDVVDHRRVSDDLGAARRPGPSSPRHCNRQWARRPAGRRAQPHGTGGARAPQRTAVERFSEMVRARQYARWFRHRLGGARRPHLPYRSWTGSRARCSPAGNLVRDRLSPASRLIRYHGHGAPAGRRHREPGPLRPPSYRQHWQLADWRDKADLLNYRRFFEVDTLIAVRVGGS
jgi:(1->4)-alpha-D-glucan 1-alpha-D-glucosylmutase